MNDTLKREVQTLYRMGATHRKLWPVYRDYYSPSQIKRICSKLPRDLRDQRILHMWEEGKTCEEIKNTTNLSTYIIRLITRGIKNGRFKRVHNCKYCGKEFEQKRFADGSFCRRECKRRSTSRNYSATKKNKRNKEVRKMRDSGMTYRSIGDKYGLTKEGVYAIVRLDEAEV